MKTSLRSLVAALAAAVSFTHASFAELPARFAEYLDVSGQGATGTQWLELDYTPSSAAKFEFKAALKDQSIVHTFFCARTDFKVDTYSLFWINWGTGLRLDYKDAQKNDAATSSGLDKPFTVVVDGGAVSVNGTPNSAMSFAPATFTAGNKLVLFGSYVGNDTTPTGNFAALRLYSFKISEGDEVKFDFWPCVDEQGVAGLFDLVTGKIFYSNGTADFGASETSSAGPLKPDQILVTGKPDQCGTGLEPEYGISSVAAGSVTCTAPVEGFIFDEGKGRAALSGWKLKTLEADLSESRVLTGGRDDACVFNHVAGTYEELMWSWQTEYRLTTEFKGSGVIETEGEWFAAGAETTLTAVADDGYAFSCWEGDVPAANRHDNPLTVRMDAAKTLTAVFATARYVDFRSGVDDEEHSSETAPWKTLAYAVAQANEGDELVLAKCVHELASDIIIEKKLTIRGAGRSDETTLDAKHDSHRYTINVAADGCLIHSLTFYRLGDIWQNEVFQLKSDSVVSNVAFTACGNNTGNNQWFVRADKGLITCCFVTNNIGFNNAGFYLGGSATVENCLFRDNQVVQGNDYGRGILDIGSSDVVVRNCTIVNNRPRNFRAIDVRSGCAPKVYNNIIWGNVDYTTGEPRNWSCSASKSGWVSNCTSPVDGLPAGNISDDPKFKLDGVHLTSDSPCRNGKANEGGAVYATAADMDGVLRGIPPCMGAFEYVEAQELEVTPLASATFARLPDVIRLSCNVSGAVGELTYAWSFNNDGTVDSTEAEPALDRVGIYHPSVTVRDEGGQVRTAVLSGDYLVHSAEPVSFFVSDEAGSDETGDGSYDSPFKTIQKALTAGIAERDEIVLKKGEHKLTGDVKVYTAITIRGEGESWETTIDAEHQQYGFLLSADGLVLRDLTFYRLGAVYQNDYIQVLTDAVVSNVVFTGCGMDIGNNQWIVTAKKGLITCCIVTNNIGFNNAGFGLSGSATVENCLFSGNQVVQGNDYGHGILDVVGSGVTVRNCTIVNNRVRNYGAVVVNYEGRLCKFYNNIIWGNVDYSTEVPNNWWCASSLDNWMNNCTTTSGLPSPSNIEKEPQFVDAANGDFHLTSASPCVNAGLNLDYTAKSVDLDGNARIYKFGLKSSKADMGCYESPYGVPGLLLLVR